MRPIPMATPKSPGAGVRPVRGQTKSTTPGGAFFIATSWIRFLGLMVVLAALAEGRGLSPLEPRRVAHIEDKPGAGPVRAVVQALRAMVLG